MVIIPPEIRNMNNMLAATERFIMTRVGAMAVSGIRTSTTPKMTSKMAKATKRPMIRGVDHGYRVPPY